MRLKFPSQDNKWYAMHVCSINQGTPRLAAALRHPNAVFYRTALIDVLNKVYLGESKGPDGDETFKSITLMQKSVKRSEKHKLKTRMQSSIKPEYVYAAQSSAFPGLLKIGRTNNLDVRIRSSATFSAPSPFKIVASVSTMNSKRDEFRAHNYFAHRRHAGEFFYVTVDEVVDFFQYNIYSVFQREFKLLTDRHEAEVGAFKKQRLYDSE